MKIKNKKINPPKADKFIIKLGKYKHSKSGKMYEVIEMAHHSETMEELVIYRALYNSPEFGENAIWARPKDMFFEKIKINGKEVSRFEFIEE